MDREARRWRRSQTHWNLLWTDATLTSLKQKRQGRHDGKTTWIQRFIYIDTVIEFKRNLQHVKKAKNSTLKYINSEVIDDLLILALCLCATFWSSCTCLAEVCVWAELAGPRVFVGRISGVISVWKEEDAGWTKQFRNLNHTKAPKPRFLISLCRALSFRMPGMVARRVAPAADFADSWLQGKFQKGMDVTRILNLAYGSLNLAECIQVLLHCYIARCCYYCRHLCDSEMMSNFSGRRSICVFSLQAAQSIHYQPCVATHAARKQALEWVATKL